MAAALQLDRMVIEEAGPKPEAIAAAIHSQLGQSSVSVPVHAIAAALDIVAIRTETLSNLEGALVAAPERSIGTILVNQNSHLRRRNFTIAHELGHFLNLWHQPSTETGFACTSAEIYGSQASVYAPSRQEIQEAEANRFAIELLAPPHYFADVLGRRPSLSTVVQVASRLQISREATARRFIDLQDQPVAIFFSRAGYLRYAIASTPFPSVRLRQGDKVPTLSAALPSGKLTEFAEAEQLLWLVQATSAPLLIQTLYQRDGYAMTMLVVVRE